MGRYYCPLTNSRNSYLSISQIRYTHFKQLQDIDEGYQVEFKSRWDNDFKRKHLCQTISSFANTEGGWLFVGVDDSGIVTGIEKERTDFSQQISEILKTHTSPLPLYDVRYVKNPNMPSTGVLVIFVHEGVSPPYVCNGTIYLRNGSSKHPVKISNRAELDNLTAKRNKFEERLNRFCTKDIYDDDEFPCCTIYFYNHDDTPLASLNYSKQSKENDILAAKYKYQSWMISTESTLFFNSSSVAVGARTTVLELFDNYSLKLYVPLSPLPEELGEALAAAVLEKNNTINLDGFTAIEGYLAHTTLKAALKSAFSIIHDKKINTDKYTMRVELKNIQNCYIVFSATDGKWMQEMCTKRFRYSAKKSAVTPDYRIPNFRRKDIEMEAEFPIAVGVFPAFGWAVDDYLQIKNITTQKAYEIFGDSSFTLDDFYSKVYGWSRE